MALTTNRVLALRHSRPIAFWIVDPCLQIGAGPCRSSAAQVDWGRKPPFRYAAVDRRPAQRTDAHHIAQAVEGGRGLGKIWLGQRLMEEHGGFLSSNVESMHPSSAQTNPRERSPECPIQVKGRTSGLLTGLYPPVTWGVVGSLCLGAD